MGRLALLLPLLLLACGGEKEYRVERPVFRSEGKRDEEGAVSVGEIVRLLSETRDEEGASRIGSMVDPFHPSPEPAPPPPRRSRPPAPPPPVQTRLEGIVRTGGGGASASIDGELYRVGDRIDGWEIQAIEGDAVKLVSGEKPAVVLVGERLPRGGSAR